MSFRAFDKDQLSLINDSDDSSDFRSPNGEKFCGQTTSKSADAVTTGETSYSGIPQKLMSCNSERHTPMLSLSGNSKENIITATEANLSGGNILSSNSSVSNMPQDILMKLIQSGHLQLHTEEDGSGHQYVAIPLGASVTSFLTTGSKEITKEKQNAAAFKKSNSTIRETSKQKEAEDHNKPKSESYHSKAKTEITINREPQ